MSAAASASALAGLVSEPHLQFLGFLASASSLWSTPALPACAAWGDNYISRPRLARYRITDVGVCLSSHGSKIVLNYVLFITQLSIPYINHVDKTKSDNKISSIFQRSCSKELHKGQLFFAPESVPSAPDCARYKCTRMVVVHTSRAGAREVQGGSEMDRQTYVGKSCTVY